MVLIMEALKELLQAAVRESIMIERTKVTIIRQLLYQLTELVKVGGHIKNPNSHMRLEDTSDGKKKSTASLDT